MEKYVVKIEAQREAYSIGGVMRRTMTVRELIEQLEQFDDDTPVILSHDNGYTYGGIHYYDIEEIDADEPDGQEA